MRRLTLLFTPLISIVAAATLTPATSAGAAEPEPTFLVVGSHDTVLEENGDGLWESATVEVSGQLDSGSWTVRTADGAVVGGAALTPEQVAAANDRPFGYLRLPIDSDTLGVRLPAGPATVTVTGVYRDHRPTTASTVIHVSDAPAVTAPRLHGTTIFPRDSHPGVDHVTSAVFTVGATARAHEYVLWQVVGPSGLAVDGPYPLRTRERTLTWDGATRRDGEGGATAPAGTYHLQLLFTDGGSLVPGARSAPIRVSHDYRTVRDVAQLRSAASTRTRTLRVRDARLRAVSGSLRYRALDRRAQALVRTEHVVRVPASRAPGYPIFLRLEGRHRQPDGFDLEVVLADGRVRDVDIYAKLSNRQVWYVVPPRLIRRDGTVRFRVRWDGFRYDGPARLDQIGVQTTQYVWHSR
ncbi:hypothetical protein [Nocardioides sp.]|uniref:hypothetical protein n=1 Tax=Nocardioides sp. TaxID=35761 RepID=UPI003514E658